MNKAELVTNNKTGSQINTKPGATCQTKGVVYAVKCKKCDLIYVGHTGDSMNIRFSKHKYDIKNRPKQTELTTHCEKDHNIEDLEIFILDHGLHELNHRKQIEDKFICRLQTLQPTGMNIDLGPYAKEMYRCWSSVVH